ncbi:MAG: M24 family metallopeptidase [Acidobacteriota bacterium]|nr:M24 family metallopeptidase [Acidobacteriota bacterium]
MRRSFAIGLSFVFLVAAGVPPPPLHAQFGFRHTNVELRDIIRKDKLDLYLLPLMQEYDIDCWVTLTRDPNDDMTNVVWDRKIQLDPIVEYIGGEDVTVPAAFIFTRDGGRTAIAATGDREAIMETGIYSEVLVYTFNREKAFSEFQDLLGAKLNGLNPRNIALNYSLDEGVADGLTLGMKMIFDAAVGPELSRRVVSAEKIIISLWNRKTPAEIQLITKSARRSAAITEDALRMVVPGVTTARGIFDYIRQRGAEEGLEPGWQEYWSPTVTVGAFRLGKPPRDKVVERGDLIVINSGFLVEGHMADINKMAYVLREGEDAPPSMIQKIFDTGLRATEAAVSLIRPGATGVDIDRAARDIVVGAGFKEYGHATGHTTGVWVHGLGAILGPPWKAYGEKISMTLQKNDIYAIEPSVTVFSKEHGGNLRVHFQEMVIVEENGARYLTPPVKELMLIR